MYSAISLVNSLVVYGGIMAALDTGCRSQPLCAACNIRTAVVGDQLCQRCLDTHTYSSSSVRDEVGDKLKQGFSMLNSEDC